MVRIRYTLVLILYLVNKSLAYVENKQRIAPGVNPQNYQHIPIQQQQYQTPAPAPQMYHQQQGLATKESSQQQQQSQRVLNAGDMNHERAHIQEHMQIPIDNSKMSEAELQFHYFKMHDSDNNNKLDGCELIKSLIHWHEQNNKDQHDNNTEQKSDLEAKVFSDEDLMALIDPILQMDDTSRDGYIDYTEFKKAQQKAALKQQQNT